MARIVHITAGSVEAIAELNSTTAGKAIWDALPIKSTAETWGDEIYFPIPVYTELESGTVSVQVGDLGYWPPGNSLCIFFGPTPISQKNEIKPASPITLLGRIIGNARIFESVKAGASIVINRHDEKECG